MTEKITSETLLFTGGNIALREAESRKLASQYSSEFDTHIIDANQEGGIDNVRDVVRISSRKPYQSQLTSIIILEANKLNSEAQNALLKELEEPSSTCQIILTAPTKDSLLPTVASRLQEIALQVEKRSRENLLSLNLFELSLSQRLDHIEKLPREEYLQYWADKLKEEASRGNNNLQPTHRYNRLLIKMLKAQKGNVNHKLIDLILALEIPNS